MPTLHWIGKEKVVNHHQNVPFRVLEHKYTFQAEQPTTPPTPVGSAGEGLSGNKIIHGDNLEALKALLPQYEGRIKCIYIDPPYNTGNEQWVYNDNVNHPKIKKWLGEVVGKQGEDLSRHDKWLCMMYPRLVLLHKLLADDGAIFISIDDNEQANLKLICDEIFGVNNFVTNFIWHHRKSSQNDIDFSLSHNSTLCYSKNRNTFRLNSLPITEAKFKNPDNDPRGSWVADPMDAPNIRENLQYEIVNPNTNKIYLPPKGRHWRFTKEKYDIAFADNRILFGKTGKSKPQYKRFLFEAETKGVNPFTIWSDLGTATEATKELMQIFNGEKVFQTPKPVSLLNRILEISTNKNSIILDSFAGSGTTAQAVLNANKDGGNRKFILIEMEDYADSITAERVKRVMQGYGTGKSTTEGTGGSFDYYELGQPLFKEDKNLNEEIGEEKIREYIYFSETKQYLDREQTPEHKYLLDTYNDTGYYFYYEKDKLTTLSIETLDIVTEQAEQYLIYADRCLLDKDYMLAKNIIFKKIPRDIRRF